MIGKVIKYLVAAVALLGLLLIVAQRFSEIEHSFECKGTITHDGTTEPLTAYVQLNEYRWWVDLWDKSYGNLYVEIQKSGTFGTLYYSDLRKVDSRFFLFHHTGEYKGFYSRLSGTLEVHTDQGLIQGKCVRIEKF